MIMYLVLLYGLIGICIGSFLWKLSDGSTVSMTKRSKCDTCSHALIRFELIPIFSRIAQGGKCRYCNNNISSDYLVSELLSGLVFAIVGYVARVFPFLIQLQLCLIASIMLYLSFYDVRRKELSISAFVLLICSILGLYLSYISRSSNTYGSLVSLFSIPFENYIDLIHQIGVAIGLWGCVRFLVRLLGVGIYYKKHSSLGQGLGFGDVLFACALGGLLPFIIDIISMFLGSGGLQIGNYYMRYGALIIYHLLFSSILGLIGFFLLKNEEFAFLPYMFGGFLILAIVIYNYSDYFISLLSL